MSQFYEDFSRREGHYIGYDMEAAHKKAEGLIKDKRIAMEDFVPPYDPTMVERDRATVEELKEKFENTLEADKSLKEKKHASVVLEAVISDQISRNMWFGGNTQMVHTTEYDDFVNGVDGVVSIKESGGRDSYLALGIDVTFSSHLERKIARIREELDRGEMGTVKYFQSANSDFKGELKRVPRVILGADASTVSELAAQWVEGNDAVLKKHWLQYQLLEMAIRQCHVFSQYARKIGFTDGASAYEQDLERLKSIKSLKEKVASSVPEDRDKLYHQINKHLEDFK